MKKHVLITDTLFVMPQHEEKLRAAGFLTTRIEKPKATEQELVAAIRGKHGYILGGIEQVTEPVIAAADVLEAICFTGSGYTEFIPGHKKATEKGIAITAAVGGNAQAVAEYTIALILSMIRRLPQLTSQGGPDFYIAPGFSELTLGIVGLGHVGRQVARLATALGFKVVAATRTQPRDVPVGVEIVPLVKLMQRADVITVHVDKEHGVHVLGAKEIGALRDGAIVINAAFPEAIEPEAIHARLKTGQLFAAYDAGAPGNFSDVPAGHYFRSNAQTAFNTRACNLAISDRVVDSMIALLTKGDGPDLVNPDFKKHRSRAAS
jgi:D-3-phosphoglycerate dehydrogenase